MRKTALTLDECGLKIGDIIVGSTYWYCTTPHFYKIVGFKGKKTIVLERMMCAYDSKYGSNSPLYFCVPEECDPEYKFYHFNWGDRKPEVTTARVYAYNNDTYIQVGSGRYDTILCQPWDGTPQQGNCD